MSSSWLSGPSGTWWSCGMSSPKLRPSRSTRSCGASPSRNRCMPPPRDLASRGDDGRCEVRLDTPPFLGEGRLPVRLQQPGEPRDELARVVEEERCRSLRARAEAEPPRTPEHHRTNLGV